MGCYAISLFRNKRGQHSAVNASTRTESKHFQMFYRVHKSQTSENTLSTFSLQVQGETPWQEKTQRQSVDPIWSPHFHGADVRDALFKHENVQCSDAFGNTGSGGYEEHADLWFITLDEDESTEKKSLLKSHLLPLMHSAQSVWLYMQ